MAAQQRWLGVDIGGANLKIANLSGFCRTEPFALWMMPDRLAHRLAALIREAPRFDAAAVTMTGELADCFTTKREGVAAIVRATRDALGDRHVLFGGTDGKLIQPAAAIENPLRVAAANWIFLAEYATRFVDREERALLLDVGSTTTDIVPLTAAGPCPAGRTDAQRLLSRELVYTGADRTPLFGVVDCLPFRGAEYPVMREVFATTADAYVLLGACEQDPGDTATADGRPRTKECAVARMARMIGMDADEFKLDDAVRAAEAIHRAQLRQLTAAVSHVARGSELGDPGRIVTAGSGDFLARDVAAQFAPTGSHVSLGHELGNQVSSAATAYAIAAVATALEHPEFGGSPT